MNSDRPIIVVGCPRSGTTLLQLMLHAHPRIAIPPENRFLLPLYQDRRNLGDLRDPADRRALARRIVAGKKTKFADFGLDPDQVTEEIVAAPPTLGSALETVFRAYARRFGKPRWGDKRPSYIMNIDAVLRLFPDAQVVNIVRDGRDCVASLKEMTWYHGDSYQAVATWAKSVRHARSAARRLGPDTFHELRYESLVADPERELTALCTFLGERFHPAMVEPAAVASTVVPERKTHHDRTRRPVDDARAGSWAQRLEPWEVSLCEAVLGRQLRRYGYELTGAPPPPVGVRLRYERVAFHGRLAVVKQAGVRAYHRVGRPSPVAAGRHATVGR